MTDRLTGVRGLVVEPAPPLFPDHPDACFVIHTASNRRLPATWVSTEAAQQFVAAVRDMADWTDANVTGTAALAQVIDEHDGTWDVYGVPRLPTPPYVPTPAEIADLLAGALDVLALNGWCQGEAFDTVDYDVDQEDEEGLAPDQCRVGARGAIHVAAEGHPSPPEAYESSVLASAATAALTETLGVADVTVWNDAAGRTVDELHAAVTRTVDRLRAMGR
ncbi:hypothetical protein GCM10017744_102810 [Streptomyces antimycoticus]|uniref:Uncharacterized protein n=1 Tax=Streptomyces antimycoticus TaxID=68175 RepID=A0A4D4KK33_9ACTN|nr:hypothetical protein [Streptomyces antimycoticus]GDY49315.1 hypothetical protein SANT12839_101970 [Streptomyces antimycoticus]